MTERLGMRRGAQDSPFLMAGQVSLSRLQTLPVAMEAMDGVARKWAILKEARIMIQPLAQGGASVVVPVTTGNGFGSIVEVRLKSGRNYMTQDFVPASLLGPTILPRNEWSPQSVFRTTATDITMFNAEHYTWKFSKPMLLGPGTPIDCEVRRPADTLGLDPSGLTAFRVTVALAGVKLESAPNQRVRCVPWAMHFRPSPAQYAQNTSYPDVNAHELVLRNPFRRPLHVQRANFRVTKGAGSLGIPTGQVQRTGITAAVNNFKLRLWDGYNNEVYVKTNQTTQDNLNAPVPVSDMYMTGQMNSVMLGDVLLPTQYYRATMGKYLDTDAETSFVPMFALVGHREELMT